MNEPGNYENGENNACKVILFEYLFKLEVILCINLYISTIAANFTTISGTGTTCPKETLPGDIVIHDLILD